MNDMADEDNTMNSGQNSNRAADIAEKKKMLFGAASNAPGLGK